MYCKCTSMNELNLKIQNRRVICWGIGNYFQAFLDSTSQYENELEIVCLIDNNEREQGEKREINGKQIPILSFEQYLSIRQRDDLLIITTVHYQAIADQIESVSQDICYIIYTLIQHTDCRSEIRIKRDKIMRIPPIIHYCWFGRGQVPETDKRYIAGWREKCPEYKMVCWNEDNFDINKNVYVKWAYKNKKWAFVSDYVRLYALYVYGGIYLDTDVELLKNLDELRYQYAYMGMEASGCVNSGVGMGTEADNPIIGEMLELYDNISEKQIQEWKTLKANVAWEREVLKRHGFRANNHYQIIENIAIFPSEYFSPVLVGKEEISVTKNTFSIHHYHYSWLSDKERTKIWEKRGI